MGVKILKPVLLIILISTLISCDALQAFLGSKKQTYNSQEQFLYIPSSVLSIEDLTALFLAENLISLGNKRDFLAVLNYKEFTADKIGHGKYKIAPNTDFKTLINSITINKLGNGNQELEVEVTFNNCKDVYAIAGKVSKQIEMDSTQFINYLLSDSILRKYGFTEARIGSLFLPNTYRFYWDTDEQQFIERMAEEFRKFWTDERKAKIAEVGLKSQSDVVTLASIVYQEQNRQSSEWQTIAGLYLNRIRIGMKLQSDPTFRFCWGNQLDGVQRLTFEHRAIDCPYNTYLYAGLPPGPIYIPPASVIDAVLNASKNNYLYMCAQPDYSGLHNFASNLAEHNRNAKIYQSWLSSIKK